MDNKNVTMLLELCPSFKDLIGNELLEVILVVKNTIATQKHIANRFTASTNNGKIKALASPQSHNNDMQNEMNKISYAQEIMNETLKLNDVGKQSLKHHLEQLLSNQQFTK